MHIANPIYDVVFKYLMEDNEIAKLMIGTIIDEEILELDFLPQENVFQLDRRVLTVYRLDFSAKIKLPDGGYKQVLIEIQKAKLSTDIMRFRQYLGKQYQDRRHSYEVQEGGRTKKRAIPIVTIYFLGYPLEKITVPVIKVSRNYVDVTNGEVIETQEEFIESLTHDSYVIQIPHLHPDRQSEVEQLLSVFDQNWVTDDRHILNINEADYPEKYRPIIRRLQAAIAEPKVREIMDAEDDLLEELDMLERELAERDKQLVEQQQALIEERKRVAEQQQALTEKDKLIAELQQRLKDVE